MEDSEGSFLGDKKIKVVFVLGGPGSGKGTQCEKIAGHFGFSHLSVGELLRKETKSASKDGAMIQHMMQEGTIIPAQLTVKLLQRAMFESGNDKFLLDGFPRDEDNRISFEELIKREPDFVLFLDCSVEVSERRILNRNQGRDDDNIETMRKRFKVFVESTMPVVEYYYMKGKVQKVDGTKTVDEIFEDLKPIFDRFCCEENFSSSIWTLTGLNYVIYITIRSCRAVTRMIANILSKIFYWK